MKPACSGELLPPPAPTFNARVGCAEAMSVQNAGMSGEASAAALRTVPAVEAVEDLVLSVRPGRVQVLAGIDAPELRHRLDAREPNRTDRAALFLALRPRLGPDALVELILDGLAETALRLWPDWYGNVAFGAYRANSLEREAARLRLAALASEIPGLSETWAKPALAMAHSGRRPRVRDCPREIELAQLSLAISRGGLVLVTAMPEASLDGASAFVHAAEWAARKAGAGIVVLCPELPPPEGAFGRILFGAQVFQAGPAQGNTPPPQGQEPVADIWLVPVIGRPHPMSDIEQRLAAALGRDAELSPLFGFNQLVRTSRGLQPRVDLLWADGKLVVELDGYFDHNTRAAFARDRHRDYELTFSGYTVLRLANDEIAEDLGKAVEKIRDLVRMRRRQQAARLEP